jgi:predicted phosphodiesterase
MRVAIMSDIHGFDLALEVVLADLATREPFDAVIVAGDLCEIGPAPDAVLARLRQTDFTVLQGNTDRDLVEAASAGWRDGEIGYALDQIGNEGVACLAARPFSHRLTPPSGVSPTDDLLAFHANPFDLDRELHPGMSDRELSEVIEDTRAAVFAFGHVHIAYTRLLGQTLLVDVAAVGNSKDRELRCTYAILTWEEATRRWQVERRRLDYPLTATAAQIRASGLPNPEKTLRKLTRGSD